MSERHFEAPTRAAALRLRGRGGPVGPELDDTLDSAHFRWAMAGVLFGIGATIGALSLIVPHPEAFNVSMLWTNIAVSYLGALICFVAAPKVVATWPIHALLVAGTVLITRAAYFSGDPNGFYTLFYVWIGLYVVFFFPRLQAILHMALVGAAYAWLLVELDASAAPARWVTAIGTISLGAYLIDSLVGRLRTLAVRQAAVAREREELMGMLKEVARTDDLTGLPNRRAWDEALVRELSRAERDSTPLCIGFIDLDRFKDYNDLNGHQAGDRLLKELAAAWRQELRATDVIARYGGEEFSLALPGCDIEDARLLVERLRCVVPEAQTASAGIVLWDGAESGDVLLGRADKALYAAKSGGRDRVILA